MSANPTRILSILLAVVLVLAPVRSASAAPPAVDGASILTLQSTSAYAWHPTPACLDIACEFQAAGHYADPGGVAERRGDRALIVIGVIVLVAVLVSASGGGGGGVY